MGRDFTIGQPRVHNDTDEIITLWIDSVEVSGAPSFTGEFEHYRQSSAYSVTLGSFAPMHDLIIDVHLEAAELVAYWMRSQHICTRLFDEDLEVIQVALKKFKARFPNAVARRNTGPHDAALAWLVWLEWWIEWALKNCELPAILYR